MIQYKRECYIFDNRIWLVKTQTNDKKGLAVSIVSLP